MQEHAYPHSFSTDYDSMTGDVGLSASDVNLNSCSLIMTESQAWNLGRAVVMTRLIGLK